MFKADVYGAPPDSYWGKKLTQQGINSLFDRSAIDHARRMVVHIPTFKRIVYMKGMTPRRLTDEELAMLPRGERLTYILLSSHTRTHTNPPRMYFG